MTLSEYMQTTTQAKFAAQCGVSCGTVSHWLRGRVRITAERARQIEHVTRGAVTALDLRPDIFGEPRQGAAA
jgi:DNA-binding transcriptional regulator YdaS (Cro superfamily)